MKEKQIVFIEGYSTIMFYKISKKFREKGYKTILIRILKQNSQDKDFYKKAYDQVIDINLDHFMINKKNIPKIIISSLKNLKSMFLSSIKMLKLKPYVIFGRSPLNSPIAFFRIWFRKTPFIYFPYDIRSQAEKTYKEARKLLPAIEIKAERFNFENCDGVMHKGEPNELDYVNGRMLGNNIILPKNTITIHPYCSDEFNVPFNKNKISKKDNEIHFVYIGGPLKPNFDFYYQELIDFKSIIEQKMHVHFYFCSWVSGKKNLSHEKSVKKVFFEKYKNFPNIEYFHIHDSFDPKEILKEISKYDFGLASCISLLDSHDLALKLHTGNKYFSYLEAGIPFFYLKEIEFMDKLMAKHNINLYWPNDFNDLHKVIKNLDYNEIEKNVDNARKDYSIEKHFPRLEKFVKDVVRDKKLR